MNTKKDETIVAVLIALVVEFIYYFQGGKWSAEKAMSNIQIYILGAVIFFLVFTIMTFIMVKIKIRPYKIGTGAVILAANFLFGIVYFINAFAYETESYPQFPLTYYRHMVPGTVYIVVLVLCSLLVYSLIADCNVHSMYRGGYRTRGIYTVLVIVIQTLFLYCPNPFNDTLGKISHIDAYTNSIINTLHYVPHEQYSASIYGHYGLLYIIPCKLFQMMGMNQWRAVTVTIAIIGGSGFALSYWVLHKIIRNNVIYVLSVLAISITSVEIFWNQYYQNMPHRYLFHAVILAWFLKTHKEANIHRQKIFILLGWIIVSVGILWNVETGIVCATAWTVGIMFLESHRRSRWELATIIKNAGLLFGSVCLAYSIVNLYNLIVGGKIISISTFIYPIGSKNYVIEELSLPLQESWGTYFVVVAAILAVMGYYIKGYFRRSLTSKQLVMLLAAIVGYGVYTYYINRVVEGTNASIVTIPFVVILAGFCDNVFVKTDKSLRSILQRPIEYGTSLLVLIILSSMALSTVGTFGKTLSVKLVTTYDETNIRKVQKVLREKIPEDTVAFGFATAQLFAYANLDTGLYFADWEDLAQHLGSDEIVNPDAMSYLMESLETGNYKHILVYEEQEIYLSDDYEEIDRFVFESGRGELCYKLYERK